MVLTNLSAHRDKPSLRNEEAGLRDVPPMFIKEVGHTEITRCIVESYDVRVIGRLNGNDRREYWRKAISKKGMLPLVVYALHWQSFPGNNM